VKGLIAWFARNGVAANLLMAAMVVVGLGALFEIQQKSFPDIEIDIVRVSVPYLGAAPEESEEGVCIRIEEAIQGINGIEYINSTAAEGACTVSAELLSGYDVDRALGEIKNAVDAISTFPEETEQPVVAQFEMRRVALQIALSGDVDERTLKHYGQRIRDDLAAIDGITQVDLTSVRNYEVSIEVSEHALRRHGLTFDQVVSAVRRSSLDLPGGSIKSERGEILLRSKGQSYTGDEFGEIVVLTREDGTRLHLDEIANVVDGFEEDDRFARFDGDRAVMIQVYRIGDQKVLDVVAKTKAYVADAKRWLPEGLELTVWRDGSQALRDRLDILMRNGKQGFVLVFVVLALFLRLRLAIWVSVGVPLSILGALSLFPFLGISIDVISLFAFILVLGLLVDDAIVVGENVHSHQERAEDPMESAIIGTQEVSIPVMFGVFTTIAAFFPMITAPGMMGQIFSSIGIVVVLCLFFSLVESQLILPSHLSHTRSSGGGRWLGDGRIAQGLRAVQARWKRVQSWFAGSLVRFAENHYRPLLELALEWRYTTWAIATTLLLWTLAVVATGVIRFSFFPPVEADYITAAVTMPQGIPVEVTANAVAELEDAAGRVVKRYAEEYPELEEPIFLHTLSSVGEQPSASARHGSMSGRPSTASSHLGEVSVELLSPEGRPVPA